MTAYHRRTQQSGRHVGYAQLLPSAYQSPQNEHPPSLCPSAWPSTKKRKRAAYITGIASKSSPASFEDNSSSDMMFKQEDSGGNESTRDKICCSRRRPKSSLPSSLDATYQSRVVIFSYFPPLPSSRVYRDGRKAVFPDMNISNKTSSPACDPPASSPFQRLLSIPLDPPIKPPVFILNQKQKIAPSGNRNHDLLDRI
jgi:hypothetical protein